MKLSRANKEIWSRRLRAERGLCNVTLREVAEIAGCCAATVSKYERGGPPSLRSAVKVFHAISNASIRRRGGVQLDLEQAIRRTLPDYEREARGASRSAP